LAIENKLLALAFRALNVLGFEVWFQNGCGPDWCFPSIWSYYQISVAKIRQHFALFLWWKSCSALP